MVKIMGVSFRLNVLLAGLALGFILCYLTTCRCVRVKEGFSTVGNVENGEKSEWANWADKMNGGQATDLPATNGANGGHSAADPVKQLEDGNMFMFNGTKFAQECCPSPYGSSTGCACMSGAQTQFLNQRGGNRTEPTVY